LYCCSTLLVLFIKNFQRKYNLVAILLSFNWIPSAYRFDWCSCNPSNPFYASNHMIQTNENWMIILNNIIIFCCYICVTQSFNLHMNSLLHRMMVIISRQNFCALCATTLHAFSKSPPQGLSNNDFPLICLAKFRNCRIF
jgi:hypothetical protein